jgi:hypothetical protein
VTGLSATISYTWLRGCGNTPIDDVTVGPLREMFGAASHTFDFHVPSCGHQGGTDRLTLDEVDGTATNGDGVESTPVSGR